MWLAPPPVSQPRASSAVVSSRSPTVGSTDQSARSVHWELEFDKLPLQPLLRRRKRRFQPIQPQSTQR
jgi:hypothetical protein